MKDLDHYQKKLVDERKVLLTDLKGVGVIKDKKNPDDWEAKPDNIDIMRSDSNEVGDRIDSYDENNALVHNLEKRLEEVDIALGKIEKGTFGVCEIGGEPIEEDRLGANPAARTCKKHLNS